MTLKNSKADLQSIFSHKFEFLVEISKNDVLKKSILRTSEAHQNFQLIPKWLKFCILSLYLLIKRLRLGPKQNQILVLYLLCFLVILFCLLDLLSHPGAFYESIQDHKYKMVPGLCFCICYIFHGHCIQHYHHSCKGCKESCTDKPLINHLY